MDDVAKGKSAAPCLLPHPRKELIDGYEKFENTITLGALLHFARAVLAAVLVAGFRGRAGAFRRLMNSHPGPFRACTETSAINTNVNDLKYVLAEFLSLRPLLWRRRDSFPFEHYVLLKLFEYRNMYPTLVLGVSAAPDETLSWLQYGELAIDCEPEIAIAHSPILVVRTR